jgi:hypothetical protein
MPEGGEGEGMEGEADQEGVDFPLFKMFRRGKCII